MKYYLIVGEASGDLHASRLMSSLKLQDAEAEFRFFGGDLMAAVGGTCVKHYKDMAYMGFIPVLLHLRTIFRNIALCKRDILALQPDVVILVDYPGFNLKIWAWKEWRIKAIRRDIDELFSILPFEVAFYETKHHYPIHYVGNPTVEEIAEFKENYHETREDFCRRNGLDLEKPIIALLAGSRKQEITDNLPTMMAIIQSFPDYQSVLACAPSVEDEYYARFLACESQCCDTRLACVKNETYALLSHASVALVTSGTATLETALFNVPQVVCYKTPIPRLIRFAFNHFLSCKYISLVNLIADKEVVQELFADRFNKENILQELRVILPGQQRREQMLNDYVQVRETLGHEIAPDNAAHLMVELLKKE